MTRLPVLNNQPDQSVEALLRSAVRGEVHFDGHHRLLYSTDASIYQVPAIGLVLPVDSADVAAAVRVCSQTRTPILPRGGGTSLAGQCTNSAVVLDLSRHFRNVHELDIENRRLRLDIGLTVDEVNRWLAERGRESFAAKRPEGCSITNDSRPLFSLFFAPDPATSAQAAIGGCIGNNAAGARSIRYGRTSENVAGVEVVLSDGRRTWLEEGAGRRDNTARELAGRVAAVARANADEIRRRFPKLVRRNAGYALDLVLSQIDRGVADEDLDLSGLICGSEGTLAVITSASLKLHPVPAARILAIVSYASVEAAIAAVGAIVATNPSAVELLDDEVLTAAAGNAQCRGYLDILPRVNGKLPLAILMIEYQDEPARAGIDAGMAALRSLSAEGSVAELREPSIMAQAWALRKAAEPLLHGLSAHRKPLTFVEDNSIPIENLSRFVDEFKKIVARHGTKAAYYAHASVGVLHVRPMIDLHDSGDRTAMRRIAVEVANLARDCGGVMSGEHGDGRVRGPMLADFYGPQIMAAFGQIKAIFDPAGILNPGMVVNCGPAESITDNLRVDAIRPPSQVDELDTYYDYEDQEGFAGAIEMCNGAGVCRKTAGGTMCPSYRATLDERHSTRGRGNALRAAIAGAMGNGSSPRWDDPETMETLRLCLSCKACKNECPSNVDVARLKAEYTAHHHRLHGAPLSARLFGHIRKINALASLTPSLANWIANLRPIRALSNRLLNLHPNRSLPRFAKSLYKTFPHVGFAVRTSDADLVRTANPTSQSSIPTVILFADCFTTYNEPHIGQAAIRLLQAFGYAVQLPKTGCCGRSMISNGLLDDAIASADRVLDILGPLAAREDVAAIVVCEPSCLSAMTDDWLQLKLKTPKAIRQQVAAKAMLVEEFIEKHWDKHPRKPALAPAEHPVYFHGHCHQKALQGETTAARMLRRVAIKNPQSKISDLKSEISSLTVIPSGCCGMAGAFGYTADRYDLSMKIAEQSLGEHLRAAPPDAIIVAPGTSCRHQIHDLAGRHALHPVELLAKAIDNDFGARQT